ncbi:hypothetical protein CAMGR0001_1261 [Campylobacter gracilis RM3268]|uniref:Uncharacterized protein n=1 Tax=Campylobacter gracilis RM3268 TaxID=553220 RepID=C8PJ62_9BACT|nr:hypothetical protein CAMGR0001_1261 [Campylobacter gracilis RM3268]
MRRKWRRLVKFTFDYAYNLAALDSYLAAALLNFKASQRN